MRKVLIVGGGIAGPVLGMWLKRLGMEVSIAEARPTAAVGEGAFLGVAPNGMNALEPLGVAGAVAAAGTPCEAFQFLNRKGDSIGVIDRSGDASAFGRPLTMIRRGQLNAILAEEATRQGVEIRWGQRLVSVDESHPSHVIARFEDGSESSADILIGCDGLRSRVRSLILPEAPAPSFTGLLDYGGFAQGVQVPVPPGINLMLFGRRAFFGAFVTPSGEIWWFHNGAPGSSDLEAFRKSSDPTRERERLLELHREDPPWVNDVIRATPRLLGPWPIYDLHAMPRWHSGRVCLLGDAAHAMSPSAGQGAALAMEDALVLAQCLRDIDAPSKAFATFEKARRPRVDAIFRAARRNGSGKAVNSALSEWFRDRMLPFFLRLGASGQSKMYSYRLEWDQSRV
ncbi:FAD-dependent oxidoreductase [Archangium violaceum]|uniref:FAD-dependent oxidoreductase n=1 Tax=Archangium violaceum TaxID=83451 RepID=UPI0036DBEAA3